MVADKLEEDLELRSPLVKASIVSNGVDCLVGKTIAKTELVYPETMRSSRRERQRVATFHEVHQDIGTLVSL
jgi:hypothetical protein